MSFMYMQRSVAARSNPRWQQAGFFAVAIFFAWILWREAPVLHEQALARAWEGNQKGYARLNAIRETGTLGERTAYAERDGWANAVVFYLEDNVWYFSDYPTQTPAELVEIMQAQKVQHMILSGNDERLPTVRDILSERGFIAGSTLYLASVWQDNTVEVVPVYHLNW